jgi:hypothetical protein
MVWTNPRKSILGLLMRLAFHMSQARDAFTLFLDRFFHEATIIISYRFLREATGLSLFFELTWREMNGIKKMT